MSTEYEYYGRRKTGGPFLNNRGDRPMGMPYVVELHPDGKVHFLYKDGVREFTPHFSRNDTVSWKRLNGTALPAWCVPPRGPDHTQRDMDRPAMQRTGRLLLPARPVRP